MIDFLALLVGLGLTWAFGTALVGALYRLAQPGDILPGAWLVGCGWFVGAFATTLVMRVLSSTGIAFSVAGVGMPVLVLTLTAGARDNLVTVRVGGRARRLPLYRSPSPGCRRR